jgi:hypothetical protein
VLTHLIRRLLFRDFSSGAARIRALLMVKILQIKKDAHPIPDELLHLLPQPSFLSSCPELAASETITSSLSAPPVILSNCYRLIRLQAIE